MKMEQNKQNVVDTAAHRKNTTTKKKYVHDEKKRLALNWLFSKSNHKKQKKKIKTSFKNETYINEIFISKLLQLPQLLQLLICRLNNINYYLITSQLSNLARKTDDYQPIRRSISSTTSIEISNKHSQKFWKF